MKFIHYTDLFGHKIFSDFKEQAKYLQADDDIIVDLIPFGKFSVDYDNFKMIVKWGHFESNAFYLSTLSMYTFCYVWPLITKIRKIMF